MDEKLKCPKCQSKDISITVQYRKSWILRTVNTLLIIAIFLTTIFNMGEIILYETLDTALQENITPTTQMIMPMKTTGSQFAVADTYIAGPLIVCFVIMLAIFEIWQHYFEAKPRVYYICKDCNEVWYDKYKESFIEP